MRWCSDQGTYNDFIDNSFFNKTTEAIPLLLRNTLVIDHLMQSTMGTRRSGVIGSWTLSDPVSGHVIGLRGGGEDLTDR